MQSVCGGQWGEKKLRSRRKAYPQTPESERKAVSNNRLKVDTAPLCLPTSELSGVTSGSCRGHQNVDIKQIAWGFPGGEVVGNLPTNARDTGSSPGPGRSHMPQSN